MRKNIILTTMSTLPWNLATNYYFTKDAQDHILYCDGIAQTEAGTKLFLSQLRIDHIVVIGSDKTYCTDERSREDIIDSFTTPDLVSEASIYSKSSREYSYRYYKYRIAQFLLGKNLEQSLLAESIPEERRKYLEKITSEYMSTQGYTEPNEWFHIVASDSTNNLSNGLRNKIDSDIKTNFISEAQYEQYLQPVSKYPELSQLEKDINAMKAQIEKNSISIDQLERDLQNHYFSSKSVDLDYEARLFILSRRIEEYITKLEIEQYITKSAVYHEVILLLKNAANRIILQIQSLKSNRLTREFTYIKSWLYQQLDDSFILKPARENPTTSLTFVPDLLSSGNYNIFGIINAIRSISENDKDTTLDLYIDMQGGNRTDGYVKNAILSIFNNDKNSHIYIQEVVATAFESRNFANAIVNETDRYRVTDLTAGMNAFIQYGRADLIHNHLKKLGVKKDSHTGKLVSAMLEIDHALSICNVTALTKAIGSIKDIFSESAPSENSEATETFRVLEDSIRQDYGNLISNPEIDYYDLTQWAFRKGFVQQALTIIESKMPSEFVKKGICFYDDKERDKNIGILRELYKTANKPEKVYFDNINNYFIKIYMNSNAVKDHNNNPQYRNRKGKNLNKSQYQARQMEILLNPSSPDVIKVCTICGPSKMTSVLERYYVVSALRNNVNHSNENNPSFTYQNIAQAIDSFLVAYKKALMNIRQKDFHVELITADDIMKDK